MKDSQVEMTTGDYLTAILESAEQIGDMPIYRISKKAAVDFALAFMEGPEEDQDLVRGAFVLWKK